MDLAICGGCRSPKHQRPDVLGIWCQVHRIRCHRDRSKPLIHNIYIYLPANFLDDFGENWVLYEAASSQCSMVKFSTGLRIPELQGSQGL